MELCRSQLPHWAFLSVASAFFLPFAFPSPLPSIFLACWEDCCDGFGGVMTASSAELGLQMLKDVANVHGSIHGDRVGQTMLLYDHSLPSYNKSTHKYHVNLES